MHHLIKLMQICMSIKLTQVLTINSFASSHDGVLTEGLMFDFQYRLRPMMMRGLVSVFTFVSAMMKFILLI